MDSLNGVEDKHFNKLREADAFGLTDIHKFFPELAWRKVLEKLKKKPDIDNCSNASPFFGDLLQEKRESTVVLPTVFGILARRYNDGIIDASYLETNAESIPWRRPANSEKPHWMTGIWKCRLVCKKWNEAIEEIHRDKNAGHYEMTNVFDKDVDSQFYYEWGTDRFSEESAVVKFLDHFNVTHYDTLSRVSQKCSFLSRAVDIGFNEYTVLDEHAYWNKMIEMFEKFGDQVHYFKFVWETCSDWVFEYEEYDLWREKDCVYIYLKLKQIAHFLPNLKVFRIDFSAVPFPSKEVLQSLEEEIQRNPFPHLTKLEMISVDDIPCVLASHLVNQNRQISRLEIDGIESCGNCTLFTEKLPKLTHMSLVYVRSVQIFQAFESYPFTFNLQTFIFRCSPFFPFVSWSRVFDAIGLKLNSDICTDLQLEMPKPRPEAQRMSVLEDTLECRLQLVNIQRFHFSTSARFCLDFLLPFRNNLREIKLEIYCDAASYMLCYVEHEELKDKQVIKFLGCEDNLQLFNIAKELPSLRKLKVNKRGVRHYISDPNGLVQVIESTCPSWWF